MNFSKISVKMPADMGAMVGSNLMQGKVQIGTITEYNAMTGAAVARVGVHSASVRMWITNKKTGRAVDVSVVS